MEPSVCREVAWAELTARVTPVEAVRSGMRGKKEKDRSCLQMRRLLFCYIGNCVPYVTKPSGA